MKFDVNHDTGRRELKEWNRKKWAEPLFPISQASDIFILDIWKRVLTMMNFQSPDFVCTVEAVCTVTLRNATCMHDGDWFILFLVVAASSHK